MQDLLQPAIGDQIASFRIEALIGRGGMGLVFRARQARPDRMVALKVIAPELASNDAFRARFEQESSVAAQIEHPNVIPVYEIGEDRGIVFIAMRFVNGIDLGELRRRSGHLEPAHATRLISQVASALDAAHACGLVHRDVKPGNMLVSGTNPEEHIYLTDFGLTKRSDASRGLTASGMYVGTLDYIAPEQVTGSRVDAPTDVYSLGCVLYELLAGDVPFPRETDAAKVFAHVSSQAPSLSELMPDVPPQLSRVVERAMAKSPAERYRSAGDFARAAHETAAAPPRTVPRRNTATRPAAFFAKHIARAATATAAKTGPDDRLVVASELESLTLGERAPAVTDAESVAADQRRRPTASPAADTSTPPAPETSTPADTSTPPAAKTSTSRSWPITAAVGTAAIAAVGFVIILASGSGSAHASTFRSGDLALNVGPGWRRRNAAVAGLALTEPIAISDAGNEIDAGEISQVAKVPGSLPPSLAAEYGRPAQSGIVTLPLGQARSYWWPSTHRGALSLSIVATERGEVAIACTSSAARAATMQRACGAIRDQAKLTGTRVEYPGPDPRIANRLSRALVPRAGAVGAASARLGGAHLSSRAADLRRVAIEDEKVARAVTQISAPPRDVAPIAALAAGLKREATLTRELAAAALRSSTRLYESLRGRLDASRIGTAGAGLTAVGFTRLPLPPIDVPRAPSRPRHRAAAPSATVPSTSPEAPVTQPSQPAHEEPPTSTPPHTQKKEASKTITTKNE